VSRDDAGRIIVAASRSSGTGAAAAVSASAGLNFMMRHIISATYSSPTCQVIFCGVKKP